MTAGSHLNAVKSASARVRMVGVENNGPREKDDFYATPPEATAALLGVEKFTGAIWEPACGDGAMARVLEAAGYHVVASDLIDRGFGDVGRDFLLEWTLRAPNIVTNPPFKLSLPFVRRALDLGADKVALFLKLAFLEGVERGAFFASSPLARVWVFKKRVTFRNTARGDVNGSGMMAFAWLVWERSHTGKPELGWI